MAIDQTVLNSIERAIDYIGFQLKNDSVPNLNDAARAAGQSKFHFHRVFKIVSGETFADMVTRLRLAKGLGELDANKASITQAAMAAGYGSSQAFAKAIKRETAMTASDLKNDPERLAGAYQALSVSSNNSVELKVEICSLEPFELLVLETTDAYPVLNETYGMLFEAVGNPEHIIGVLGIPHRDIETFETKGFKFDCAIVTKTVPSDLPPQVIVNHRTTGTYMIVRHCGLDAEIPTTLNVLYQAALAQNGLVISDTPCLFHYIDDPEEIPQADCRTDIYLKIETQT